MQPVLQREVQLVNNFILISDIAYTREQILRMEKTVPITCTILLVRFAKENDKETENMAFFFAEQVLMQYLLVISEPSIVLAAVYGQAQPQEDSSLDGLL